MSRVLRLNREQLDSFAPDFDTIDQFERLFSEVNLLTQDMTTGQTKAASAVALTTNVTANITSVALAAGTWDVTFSGSAVHSATTTVQSVRYGLSLTSATLPTVNVGELPVGGEYLQYQPFSNPTTFGDVNPRTSNNRVRITLSSSATVYFVTRMSFTISTLSVFGWIQAVRAY